LEKILESRREAGIVVRRKGWEKVSQCSLSHSYTREMSGVLLQSRLTIDDDNALYISNKPEERIMIYV
jgi:hypothetical protein